MTQGDVSALISRVALGDRRAFDLLYENTSAKLFGVALRLLRDRQEAEDALQEVFVKVWQRAGYYSASDTSAMSWLVAVARNHAIDRLRARKPFAEPIDEDAPIADRGPTPEEYAVAASERARIEACLEKLDPPKADAVRGAYLEGYSYQELADRHAIPVNTMRSWLRRSLINLRDCLGP